MIVVVVAVVIVIVAIVGCGTVVVIVNRILKMNVYLSETINSKIKKILIILKSTLLLPSCWERSAPSNPLP